MKQFYALLFMTVMSFQLQAQWSNDSEENTQISYSTAEETIPKVDAAPSGDIFFSYFSNASGNYDVMLQKYDAQGYSAWEEGLVVSDNPQQSWLSDYSMGCDSAGNAIISFSDIRNGNPDIFLYKIDSEGNPVWGEDGINCLESDMPEQEPRLPITSENAAIVTFIRPHAEGDKLMIYGVDAEGNAILEEEGIVYTPQEDTFFSDPYVVPALEGNFIAVYSKNTGSSMYPDRNLMAMKFNNTGTELWESPAVISQAGGISSFTDLHVISDHNGGVVVAWHDDRNNDMVSSGFVQWIDAGGNAKYPANGVEVGTTPSVHRFDPRAVVKQGTPSIMVFWTQKNSSQSLAGLYGQHLSEEGQRMWDDAGIEFHPLDDKFTHLWLARNHEEGAAVFYTIYEGGTSEESLKAAAVNTNGAYVWPQEVIPMSTAPSGIVHPDAGPMNSGQYLLAWADNRNGNQDIYAQNITTEGMLGNTNTNVSEEIQEKVNVYPNPAHSTLYITPGSFNHVLIRNMSGQIITKFDTNAKEEITFHPKQSGLFFVTFFDQQKTVTRKVTVIKSK